MTEQKNEKTEKAFVPIESQEQLDGILRKRLKDQKGLEGEVESLRAELAGKDEEIEGIRREYQTADARRALVEELTRRGVEDEGRISRVLKHVDVGEVVAEDGTPNQHAIQSQLSDVSKDLPELLQYRVGAGSGGSSKPVLAPDPALTRAEVEAMSPEDQRKPGMRGRIDRFLAGER